MSTHETSLCIAADHPALSGHFPERPLVPGVVLLDCVLAGAQRWLGRAVVVKSLSQAKFTAPLLPGQRVQMQLKLSGDELRFTLTRAREVAAPGVVAPGVVAPGGGAKGGGAADAVVQEAVAQGTFVIAAESAA